MNQIQFILILVLHVINNTKVRFTDELIESTELHIFFVISETLRLMPNKRKKLMKGCQKEVAVKTAWILIWMTQRSQRLL